MTADELRSWLVEQETWIAVLLTDDLRRRLFWRKASYWFKHCSTHHNLERLNEQRDPCEQKESE